MPASLIHLRTHWPEPEAASRRDGGDQVFVPALARFPPPMREFLGLLPVADINGSLLAALAASHGRDGGHGLVAGIFAADPFLDLAELAERLRGAGFARVANYPTLQHFDGATAEGLAAVGYDVQAEFGVLERLVAAGMSPVAYVATLKAAEAALASGLETLAYHPGLPPVPPSERMALGRIEALAAQAGARLLVHASPAMAAGGSGQPIRP